MIKNVSIKPGCIACKNCETICPSNFKVNGQSMVINKNFKENINKIIKARDMCPVKVIDVELEKGVSLETKSNIGQIISKKYLTLDVVEFKISYKGNFKSIPGQYISLKMKDKLGKFVRSYSISGVYEDYFILIIKLLKDGRGSNFLLNTKEKEKIEYFDAIGSFVLKNTTNKKYFIATGTGISPIIYMLENTPENIEKVVIFGVRFEKDIFFEKELNKFKNIKVIITVSQPNDNYKGNIGRVTDYLTDIKNNDEVYICGNPDMVEGVRNYLENNNINEKNIFFESFVNAPFLEKESFFRNIFIEGNIKNIYFLEIFFIILGLSTPLLIKFGPKSYYEISWDIAWWSLFFLIIIRPIADIFPNILFFRKLVSLRKGLGILSGSITISHFGLNIFNYYQNFGTGLFEYFSQKYFILSKWSGNNIFPRLSEITGLILLLTSNNFSQKQLGIWWKRIQKISYIYFFSAGIYIYSFGKTEALYCMIIASIIYIIPIFLKK